MAVKLVQSPIERAILNIDTSYHSYMEKLAVSFRLSTDMTSQIGNQSNIQHKNSLASSPGHSHLFNGGSGLGTRLRTHPM